MHTLLAFPLFHLFFPLNNSLTLWLLPIFPLSAAPFHLKALFHSIPTRLHHPRPRGLCQPCHSTLLTLTPADHAFPPTSSLFEVPQPSLGQGSLLPVPRTRTASPVHPWLQCSNLQPSSPRALPKGTGSPRSATRVTALQGQPVTTWAGPWWQTAAKNSVSEPPERSKCSSVFSSGSAANLKAFLLVSSHPLEQERSPTYSLLYKKLSFINKHTLTRMFRLTPTYC